MEQVKSIGKAEFNLVAIGTIKGEPIKVYANTPKLTKTQTHSLAWCLCDSIRKFYANPENVAKYEKWLAEKRAREAESEREQPNKAIEA